MTIRSLLTAARRTPATPTPDPAPATSPVAAAFAAADAQVPQWMTVVREKCIDCGTAIPTGAFYCPDDQPIWGTL